MRTPPPSRRGAGALGLGVPTAATAARLAALALLALGWLYPVNFVATRAALVLGVTGVFGLGLVTWWRHLPVRAALLALGLAGAFLCLGPGRSPDLPGLRSGYVDELRSFEGTLYVWGGENHLGIDCSGLPRRALMSACMKQGLRSANPGLVREAMSHWWFDESAEAMGNGYRGETTPVVPAESLNALDHSALLPGDVAVAAGGVHALAYLGDETWIQADPGPGRVVVVHAPSDNSWFTVPVYVVRWSLFGEGVAP